MRSRNEVMTPDVTGVSDNGRSNAARCEGCAELRDQLRDLTRQSNVDAMRVGKLAADVERYSALHARLFAEKTAAQIEVEALRESLFRLWPAVEKAMAGMVFTADRAGEIAADMNAIRAAIAPKEPEGE